MTKKENEIAQIESNLVRTLNEKVRETCLKVLAKVEAERDQILQELEEREKSLLNLDDYVEYGLTIKDNMLKLWQIANLGHKRQLQNLIFPEGLVWRKENEDIEPLSVNDFLFVFNLKSTNYKQNRSVGHFG